MICGLESTVQANPQVEFFSSGTGRPAVLVSEDHADVLAAIGFLLKNNGFDAEFVQSPAETLSALRRRSFDAVLLDLNYSRDTTSGSEGLELLSSVQAIDRNVPIVVMTAWGTIDLAVEAMHRGASDFVQKPWDNARLLEVLRQQMERARKLRASRIREELELQEAEQIQRALLPAKLAAPEGLTIAASTQARSKVSGDYYDVIRIDEHRSAICIADVIGKGMGAALLMSNLQATVRMLAPEITDPSELCNRLNQSISAMSIAGKFITFFYCIIDLQQMRITYTNAGHNWPMLVSNTGACERLRSEDAVLGTIRDWKYRQGEVGLHSGDRLILFTDGLTECAGENGTEFGEEKLAAVSSDNIQLSADELKQTLLAAAEFHCKGSFTDDATLVVAALH